MERRRRTEGARQEKVYHLTESQIMHIIKESQESPEDIIARMDDPMNLRSYERDAVKRYLKDTYVGKTIRIIRMFDDNSYGPDKGIRNASGKVGVIDYVDDMLMLQFRERDIPAVCVWLDKIEIVDSVNEWLYNGPSEFSVGNNDWAPRSSDWVWKYTGDEIDRKMVNARERATAEGQLGSNGWPTLRWCARHLTGAVYDTVSDPNATDISPEDIYRTLSDIATKKVRGRGNFVYMSPDRMESDALSASKYHC